MIGLLQPTPPSFHGLGRESPTARHTPRRRACGPLAPAQARPAATHKKFSMAMRTIEPSTKGPDGRGSVDDGFEFFLLLGTSEEASFGRALLEVCGVGIAAFPLGVAILPSSESRSGFRSRRAAAQEPPRRAPALTDPRLTPPPAAARRMRRSARRSRGPAPPRPARRSPLPERPEMPI